MARRWRKAALKVKNSQSEVKGPHQRYFNMLTYKLHALGDYVKAIYMFGTTDNFSTQVVHDQLSYVWNEPLPSCAPEDHHQMSKSYRQFRDIPERLHRNKGDVAVKDFLPKLKDHILAHLLSYDSMEPPAFSDKERNSIMIDRNRLYRHKIIRVNYTTYNLRRARNSLNPRTHADVMVLANGEQEDGGLIPHPYWYAQIVEIFHILVTHAGGDSHNHNSEPQRIKFLWVRWLARDNNHVSGWKAHHPHRVGFLNTNTADNAFGFLDLSQIIRGVSRFKRGLI
ncbi:hypothetical protein SERLADRAFT_439137 [Serpula lacrymans var. lacrymans S7.9]|uniref:Uncharacterized protein n=1 Tax=Serpula lacrymans var. lacrymans (strain S7.9) TaxID=578457 RepID=F8NZ14_SERL9|nr:uncharacterized protein SERLADRAFT_439137 [Serpula lacrymans var. lacrymans S7.9]EGO23834.1 hypothetical protein SERLADRAFT_439137 [Serpula lacrymans var. lacrymans S7.9]